MSHKSSAGPVLALWLAAGMLALAASAPAQPLSASEFEATPVFTDNFAGGAPVGQWELDPANLAGAIPASFVTSTPGTINAAVVALNPVGSSSNGAAMMMGNDSATAGSDFGLNYMRVINSLASGAGDSFLDLDKYRFVARVYLYSPTEIATRWQVGPTALGRPSLFRVCSWYNTEATGGGPGFGWRAWHDGSANVTTGVISGTAALSAPRWTLLSVMVDKSAVDPADWRLAITVDANGDDNLNEADALEHVAVRLADDVTNGPPGVFTVGNVARDTFPLFVDWVELYQPMTNVSDWSLY